jgi:hypothetical protein
MTLSRNDVMAAATASGAVATTSLSLGDWASIAAIAAAAVSFVCSVRSLLSRRPAAADL